MELFGLPLDVNLFLGSASALTGLVTGYWGAKTREKDQLHKMSELIAETNRELRTQLKEQETQCKEENNELRKRIRILENKMGNI
jgi:hypothetical protein